jgi:hypothetical protein
MLFQWVLMKYIVIFIPSAIFFFEKKMPTNISVFEKLSLLFLVVFSTLRYGVGRDYYSYKSAYEFYLPNGFDFFTTSPLFVYLNNIFYGLDFSYNLFIGFISFFYIAVVYSCILKKIDKCDRALYFFIFLVLSSTYFSSLNIARQSIAVSFFILTVHNIDKDRISSWVYFVIGAFFHTSIIFLLPLMITKMKVSKYIYFVLFLFYVISFIYPHSIFLVLSSLSLFGINISDRYFMLASSQFGFLAVFKSLFFLLSFFQLFLMLRLKKVYSDKYVDLSILGLIISIYISIGFNILSRFEPYFYCFYIIGIFYYVKTFKVDKYIVAFLFFAIFISLHVKDYYSPEEFSRYSAQFRLLPFFSLDEVKEDSTRHANEEDILRVTNYNN